MRATATKTARPAIDRLPPHSIEAEQGVLGCILLSPNDCMGDCIEKLKAGPLAFYDLRHQLLFQTLMEMFDEKTPVDVITLQQRLKNKNQLEDVGGTAYLATLPDAAAVAANLPYYIGIVVEKYLLRSMMSACTGIVSRVWEHEGEVDALLDDAERAILSISGEREGTKQSNIRDLVQGAITKIEFLHSNRGALTGIATGFADFDRMTSGLQGGEMTVIAARPSVGKTSLAMNIAEHVAVDSKLPVGVFSLEMTSDQLVLRMICSRARVNLRNVNAGFLAERDFPRLIDAAGRISGSPLHIDDSSGLSILQLRAKARRMWQQYGIKLFVIDYLHLVCSHSRKAENRQQEISEISGGVKSLAKELGVPIIVLSQLNRELEKRGPGERPRLSDLRESGSIEQDADLVGLLYREVGKDEDEVDVTAQDSFAVKLYIAKQRNGPTGDVDLTFFKGHTRFESAAKIEKGDMA